MIYKILLVGLLATFEIYVAIATGMAFSLSSNVLFFTTVTGGVIGVFVAAFLGDKIRSFILKYKKPKPHKTGNKDKMMMKLWEKYGVVGVGFLGERLSSRVFVGKHGAIEWINSSNRVTTVCCRKI